MNSYVLRGLLGAAVLVVSTHLAAAHVTLETGEAAAGSSYKAVLRIPHGCDGKPTEMLRVAIPVGLVDVKPMPKAGWTLSTTKGDGGAAANVQEIVWSGGNLDDAFYDEFVFRARISPEASGKILYFPIRQECGTIRSAWSEIPAAGETAHSLKYPAPALKIVASASADAPPAALKVGALTIEAPWSRATPAGAKIGAGYLRITNTGTVPDRLIGGASEVASRIEVHEMSMVDNTMRMRPLDQGLEIKPGETVELKPGGLHLMLMNLGRQLKEGETVAATLTFEKAGPIGIGLKVQGIAARGAPEAEHKH